ncbi:MAG TPA: hypothetical protein VIV35_11860 [Chitinophagaceae bacterium]
MSHKTSWTGYFLLFLSNGHLLLTERDSLKKIVTIHSILALILLLVNEINFSQLKWAYEKESSPCSYPPVLSDYAFSFWL